MLDKVEALSKYGHLHRMDEGRSCKLLTPMKVEGLRL